MPIPVVNEDALLALDVETRLTEEVRRLISALREFGGLAQTISKELPLSSKYSQLVAITLGLVSLQFSNALSKGLDKPIFLDDGAVYLKELGLGIDDLFREVDLEGRRFLAIALIDESASQILNATQKGDR